jgi:hypothetical protein
MTLDDLIKRLEEIREEHGGELPITVFLDWCEFQLDSPEDLSVREAGDTRATSGAPNSKRVVIG